MNIFVLSTGRCGSMAFTRACNHIENYTSGHESRARLFGPQRLKYPLNHIESDNRLSWILGSLEMVYGNKATYVHLFRDPYKVAESYSKRINRGSIIRAYYEAIHLNYNNKSNINQLNDEVLMEMCLDYVQKTNNNIECFLKDKSRVLKYKINNYEYWFPEFWDQIGANGDYDSAIAEFNVRHNKTVRKPSITARILKKLKTTLKV